MTLTVSSSGRISGRWNNVVSQARPWPEERNGLVGCRNIGALDAMKLRCNSYADSPTSNSFPMRQPPSDRHAPKSPLPEWATPPEVEEVDGVTRLRPNDRLIKDVARRIGLQYRDFVRHHGRDRLVLDITNLLPFGHPFHDDIWMILRELGFIGGRLAICGAKGWYIDLLRIMGCIVDASACRLAKEQSLNHPAVARVSERWN